MGTPKVMIAEDSTSARRRLEQALEGHVEVISLTSGAEAIDRIPVDRPDLVICDVGLPDRDGYAICEVIRADARLARTPVVLTSTVVDGVVLQRAAEVGADEVLPKPVAIADLPGKVMAILQQSREREAAGRGLEDCLAPFLAIPGVRSAILADREGFLIDVAGNAGQAEETAGALSACFGELSDELGGGLGQGPIDSTILEYQSSLLVLQHVGAAAILAISVDNPSALTTVRQAAKSRLPALASGLTI